MASEILRWLGKKSQRCRALAAEKGFDVDRANMRDRWRLVDEATGEPAKNERGSAAFTIADAIRFLRALPDR